MHPGDVADLLDAEAPRVKQRLSLEPELEVTSFVRPTPFEIQVGFDVQLSAGLQTGTQVVPLLGSRHTEPRFLHLDCADWDGQPPLVTLLGEDCSPLPPEKWPSDKRGVGIVRGHPLYGDRNFFCRPGTREFHTHPQHSDVPWDLHRPLLTLDRLVFELVRDIRERFIFG